MDVATSDIRKFSERVVELYTTRVKMNLAAQGDLERDVAAAVRDAAGSEPSVPDWAPVANRALDLWERRIGATRGPRIAPVTEITARVSEKRRAS